MDQHKDYNPEQRATAQAKRIIVTYLNSNPTVYDSDVVLTENDVAVVSMSISRQNWKALLKISVREEMFFEIWYVGFSKELSIGVYSKVDDIFTSEDFLSEGEAL